MSLTCLAVGEVSGMSISVDMNETFCRFSRSQHYCRRKLNRPTGVVVRKKHFSSRQKSFCFVFFPLKKAKTLLLLLIPFSEFHFKTLFCLQFVVCLFVCLCLSHFAL